MTTSQFLCAKWGRDSPGCRKDAKYTCKNCLLVAYCGPQCQKAHWSAHKKECKSDLGKKSWRPDWHLKNRQPAFVGNDFMSQFGGKKYLWGNVPAFDVVRLGANEGDDYARPLRMLFAASGDLRNVVKTIAQLPRTYKQALEVTLNDRDIEIVARNAIMLLIAVVVENVDEAADCMLHIWYSSLIRKSNVYILREQIQPLIEGVCESVKHKPHDSILGKTWIFGQRSVRLVLRKSSWDGVLSFLNLPEELTAERANEIRVAVTLAEHRVDYRDRHLLVQTPARRLAKTRFWKDGLLLPFGYPRGDLQHPNPTFFQNGDSWPMHDNADPLNGWDLKEVEETPGGPAAADVYGKLHYHVCGVLRSFLGRLSHNAVSFRLFQVDTAELDGYVEKSSFSRIEVSNISDGGYLGIHRTLAYMAPLLEPPGVNPHATLLTLFMNVVDEGITDEEKYAGLTRDTESMTQLRRYLPGTGQISGTYDPWIIRMMCAREVIGNHDHIFDRYVRDLKFTEAGHAFGAAAKEEHTIIERWPFRLKLRPGQPGAQEAFDRLLGGGVSGKERYVEWRRKSTTEMG